MEIKLKYRTAVSIILASVVVGVASEIESNLEILKNAWHDVDVSLDGCRPDEFTEELLKTYEMCLEKAKRYVSVAHAVLRPPTSAYTKAVIDYQQRLVHDRKLLTKEDVEGQNVILKNKMNANYDQYLAVLCSKLAKQLQTNKSLVGKVDAVDRPTSPIVTTKCTVSYLYQDDPIHTDLWIQTIFFAKSRSIDKYVNFVGHSDKYDGGRFSAIEVAYLEPTTRKKLLKTGILPIPSYHTSTAYLTKCTGMRSWNTLDAPVGSKLTEYQQEDDQAMFPSDPVRSEVMKRIRFYYDYLKKTDGLLKNDAKSIFKYNYRMYQRDLGDEDEFSTHKNHVNEILFKYFLSFFNVRNDRENKMETLNWPINTVCYKVKALCGLVTQFCVQTVAYEPILYFVGKIRRGEFVPVDMMYLRNGVAIFGVSPSKRQMDTAEIYAHGPHNERNVTSASVSGKCSSSAMVPFQKYGSKTTQCSRLSSPQQGSRTDTPKHGSAPISPRKSRTSGTATVASKQRDYGTATPKMPSAIGSTMNGVKSSK